MSEDEYSTIHKRILESLRGKVIRANGNQYRFLIEERGRRLDLPRKDITASRKEPGQRKKNLLYTDAVLIDENYKPKMLVEIVDSSPKDPNGIAGLVINADRVAKDFYPDLSLSFIILAEMKSYWCSQCQRGHRLSTSQLITHFRASWKKCKETSPEDILHEGVPMDYRKTLKDYPIKPYLQAIHVPSVLFLNRSKIKNTWQAYQLVACQKIESHIVRRIQSPESDILLFDEVQELFPASIINCRWVHSRKNGDPSILLQ